MYNQSTVRPGPQPIYESPMFIPEETLDEDLPPMPETRTPSQWIQPANLQQHEAQLPAAEKQHDIFAMGLDRNAWDFCKAMSRSKLLPTALQATPDHDTTADLYLISGLGHSLGMNFYQSIQGIYIIPGGLPALYVRTKRALVLRAGGYFKDEGYDYEQQIAFCTIVRDGREFTATFSVAEAINRGKLYYDAVAKQIKGTGRGPWVTDWIKMLQIRACGRACDAMFADVLMGMSSAEDAQDYNSAPVVQAVESAPAPAAPAVEKPTANELNALIKPDDPTKKKARISKAMKPKAVAPAQPVEPVPQVQPVPAANEAPQVVQPQQIPQAAPVEVPRAQADPQPGDWVPCMDSRQPAQGGFPY